MRRFSLCLSCFLFLLSLGPVYCDATEARGKITHKRADFTPGQRAKMMENARKLCRKRYGATATVYKVNYYKWRVICTDY